MCNKVYNISAYYKLVARSEIKDHLFTFQMRISLKSDRYALRGTIVLIRIFVSDIDQILFGIVSGQVAEPLSVHVIMVLLRYICTIFLFNNLTYKEAMFS